MGLGGRVRGMTCALKEPLIASVRIATVVSWYQVEARRPVKASEALPVGESSSSPGEMCHEISPESAQRMQQ